MFIGITIGFTIGKAIVIAIGNPIAVLQYLESHLCPEE